jgi:transposase
MSKNNKRLTKGSTTPATAQAGKEPTKLAPPKQPVLSVIKDIQRQSRKHYSAEEKIRIVLEGLRGESSVAEICRREGINTNIYYRWSKEFLEAGKKRLLGDTIREATAPEVQTMKKENEALKQLVAELSLENRLLKKSLKSEE